MKQVQTTLFSALTAIFICLSMSIPIAAQQTPSEVLQSPRVQQAIQSGQVSSQQVQEGIEAAREGRVSPEIIKQAQEKAEMGTLTPAEIEAGKRLLEQKKGETVGEEAPEKPAVTETEERDAYEAEEAALKEAGFTDDPSLRIFGHNLFDGAPSTFAPITAVPVSNDYVIGPGDEIRILMWGRLDADYRLEVDSEGVINFPKIGPLTVAGLSFGETKELVSRKAEAITGVNVSVSMGKLRVIQVFVLGEVRNPGLFSVSSLATAANALLSSGGPTHLGSLRSVELKRQGTAITTIDFYDFLLKGDTSTDARLMPGDVIFVPQVGPMVGVSGNVRRSAIYELRTHKSLQKALALAGGLTPRAFNQRIQIDRAFENRYQVVLDISFEELQERKAIPLLDGDQIRVFSILPSSVNAVYLYGNVVRPGKYAYEQELRLRDLLPDLQSLSVDTYFDYALIKRYRLEDMKATLLPFDLGRLLLDGEESQDIPLQPLDEIYVFAKSMFRDREYADISGEVRKPGRYFIDNTGMRLKDLIFKAGNLTRDVYLDIAHLYRTDQTTNERTIYTFSVEKAITGDVAHNLLLEDLDSIIIHNRLEYHEKYTVTIQGMVTNPGDYPYAEDMTVRDLIQIAGNVKTAAFLHEAELTRYDLVDGMRVETSIITFNVQLALEDGPEHNLRLQPMDVVNIKEIPEWWDKKKSVAVSGDVLFPGAYPIRKDERLSDVIERAGGYTDHAYLRGAVFTRESVRVSQQARIEEMMGRLERDLSRIGSAEVQGPLSPEDLAAQQQFITSQEALIEKLRKVRATGRVVIALLPLSILKGSTYDILLQDGDTLFVPQKQNTVNVIGAVYNPTAVLFDESRTEVKHYLAKTGGPTKNAEKKEMYIVRADGSVISKKGRSWLGVSWSEEEDKLGFWRSFENAKLQPGDTVIVPEKVIHPNYMREIRDITQILYQIAVTAGATALLF